MVRGHKVALIHSLREAMFLRGIVLISSLRDKPSGLAWQSKSYYGLRFHTLAI